MSYNVNKLLKPKLCTYQKPMDGYTTKEFLNIFLTQYECSLLAKFRVGIFPLILEISYFKTINESVIGNVWTFKII